jgi:hypothetical protein
MIFGRSDNLPRRNNNNPPEFFHKSFGDFVVDEKLVRNIYGLIQPLSF